MGDGLILDGRWSKDVFISGNNHHITN